MASRQWMVVVSVRAIGWALEQLVGSSAGKCLLLVLANYADEKGTCFPGQERLAKETEQSVDSVQRRLKDLEALGLISRERRGGRGAGRTSDRYKLHFDQSTRASVPTTSKAAICGVAEGAKPQSVASKTATVRLCSIDDPLDEPSDSPTPLPPHNLQAEGIGCAPLLMVDQRGGTITAPSPLPLQFSDIANDWPWEEGESQIQAEMAFEQLDAAARRHAVAAAGAYILSRKRSNRKRCHLKTYLSNRLFLDYPSDASAFTQQAFFIARGTPEFRAWNDAYRAAGKLGMPSASSHEGRSGWWRSSRYPPPGWRPNKDVAVSS